MDKTILPMINFSKKIKDYTYAVLFFVVFSFFILAVIKPNLSMIFELQNEREKLKLLDKNYTDKITQIVAIQTAYEDIRSDLHFLNESLPQVPQINQIVSDIDQTASASGIDLNGLNINEINLKNSTSSQEKKSVLVALEMSSGFTELKKFISLLYLQRRIKSIENIQVSKDIKSSSESARLIIRMTLNIFYL